MDRSIPGPAPTLTGNMDMEGQLQNDNVCTIARYPEIPVGGRLSHFLKEWETITADKLVLELIRGSYKMEFLHKPPFRGVKETIVPKHQEISTAKEINNLLSKNAIERVQKRDVMTSFYSTLFLVPKKNGEMRPVINLRPLNKYLVKKAFQNGHNNESDSFSRKRRLVNYTRSVRCILPSEDFQAASKISAVQFSGQGIPVSSSKFWSNSGTTSVHESHSSDRRLFKKTRYTSSYIPRRLACTEPNKENAVAESVGCAQPSFLTRVHSKQRKIKSSAKSGSNIHRGSFLVDKGSCIPNTRACSRIEKSSTKSVTWSNFS